MAPRTFWKGYLKFSLVNCPVSVTPATSEADNPVRRRRNAWEPQVMPPQTVDLPLRDVDDAEIAVPAAISGQSLLGTKR